MKKSWIGFLSLAGLLAGCAAPQRPAVSQVSAGDAAAVASVNTAPPDTDADWETMFVPPPVGSLLGGGIVRIAPRKVTGNDETALRGHIRHLDAAASTKVERPFVVAAVARTIGITEFELVAQQDKLQLRFGELCAINAIAAGRTDKLREIATLKAKGKTWTELAAANGSSIATVVRVTRNASELTIASYSNSAERNKGGQDKMKKLGVTVQANPHPDGPAHFFRQNPKPGPGP